MRLSFKHACSLAVLALSVAHSARAATNIDSCRAITEPGTYKLTKDLTVPADSPGTRTSCITIKGSNVTLDLNGHLIRGTNRSPNKGIEALGNGPIPGQGKNLPATGIRIANGIVADFNIGIDLLETAGALVEKVQVNINSQGLRAGRGAIVRDGRADNNRVQGLVLGPGAFVENMIVGSNGNTGIEAGPGALVVNVDAEFNGNRGIDVGTFAVTDVFNNIVAGNVAEGMVVGCPALAAGNTSPFFPNGKSNVVAKVLDVVLQTVPSLRIDDIECVNPALQPGMVLDHSSDDLNPR